MKISIFFIALLFMPFISVAAIMDGNRIMDQPMGENLCALTFDDGPSRNTPELLDMLKDYGIRATFFLLGRQAVNFPEIVKRINEDGHEIGNHSWSHPNLRTLSTTRQWEQLAHTDAVLREMGVVPFYMRPPYGSFDERTVKIANELGMDIILWSLDSHDWRSRPEDYSKLVSTRGTIYDSGALRGIFLFHDIHKSTVEDLPRIIAHLRAGGCERFVTVSEYLAANADPEPAVLMTRHPQPAPVLAEKAAPAVAKLPQQPAYPAGTGVISFARCSRPWNYKGPSETVSMEAAHAQAAPASNQGL